MGVVDNSEHLTAINRIAFVNPDFDDVSHHLTREIAGLRSAHCSCRLEHIGDAGLLQREHGKMAHRFGGWNFHLPLS